MRTTTIPRLLSEDNRRPDHQDLKSKDYFKLFNLEPTFTVDLEKLKKTFTNLQRSFHPDKVGGDTDLSSLVNEAYATLTDPHARGVYLLSLRGITISEEEDGTSLGGDFLSEVMEMNEMVDEVKSQKELEKLRTRMMDKMIRMEEDIDKTFKSNDLNECKKLLMRLKFYRTIWMTIKDKREVQ